MEHVDAATSSHIVEEAPEILPAEATQWIFEGGVPFITHGCARTNVGEGEYIHKQKVRQHSSGLQNVRLTFLPVACMRLYHVGYLAIWVNAVLGALYQRLGTSGVIKDVD